MFKSATTTASTIHTLIMSSQSRAPPSLDQFFRQQLGTAPDNYEGVGSSGISDVRGAWDGRKEDFSQWTSTAPENQDTLSALAVLSSEGHHTYNPENAYNPTAAKARGGPRTKSSSSALTPAEKKANHIKSEQKRRANIRKGYELLCYEVPELREAGLSAGSGRGGSGPGGGGALGPKTKARRKKDEAPLTDEHGTRIDGRQGPRSESVILQKTVDHTRQLQRRRRALMLELARLRAQSNKPVEPSGWEGSWDVSQVVIEDDNEDL